MNSVDIKLSKRRPFFYIVESNFTDIEIISGTVFYLTSISASESALLTNPPGFFNVIIKNISLEKYTAANDAIIPNVGGNLGTPYFLPVPWRLEGGTLLEIVANFPIGARNQVMLSGYNEN